MKNRMLRARANRGALIEALEGRIVLDATITSVAVGDVLYTAILSGTDAGGSDLYRSNLDGSNQILLGHWWSGTADSGPTSLFGFHGELFFVASKQDSWSRDFVWKSDGTVQGTVWVGNLLQYGSWPHDFFVVNDHLLYMAQDTSHQDQIFFTDGSAWGQLINPPYGSGGTGAYHYGFANLIVIQNRLYAEVSNSVFNSSSLAQTERWQTDGTVAGTRIADPFGLIQNGVLRIFGTTGNDTIRLESNGRTTRLRINGVSQFFDNTAFSSIFVSALQGDDSIVLGYRINCAASIYGNIGDDTIISGNGNDLLRGGAGADWIAGGGGDDRIDENEGSPPEGRQDTLLGNRGDDTIRGSAGADSINGGDGNDSIESYGGPDVMEGGDGDDTITGGWSGVTIRGGAGNDVLSGSYNDDLIVGGSGDDLLRGSYAEDTLDGGPGADTLDGGWGLDSMISNAEDVLIDPPQAIINQYGWLDISGTIGDDRIEIRNRSGDAATTEVVINGQVTEFQQSAIKQMTIAVGAGNDVVLIEQGFTVRATVKGGAGNDSIQSAEGRDLLQGGMGNDTLDGGAGADRVDGGPGADVFISDEFDTIIDIPPPPRTPARTPVRLSVIALVSG